MSKGIQRVLVVKPDYSNHRVAGATMLGAAAGVLAGGAIGYATSPERGDVEQRIGRGMLAGGVIGAGLGLGGGAYKHKLKPFMAKQKRTTRELMGVVESSKSALEDYERFKKGILGRIVIGRRR